MKPYRDLSRPNCPMMNKPQSLSYPSSLASNGSWPCLDGWKCCPSYLLQGCSNPSSPVLIQHRILTKAEAALVLHQQQDSGVSLWSRVSWFLWGFLTRKGHMTVRSRVCCLWPPDQMWKWVWLLCKHFIIRSLGHLCCANHLWKRKPTYYFCLYRIKWRSVTVTLKAILSVFTV